MTTNAQPLSPSAQKPTRVRYSILGLLCLLAMITYLDRAMYGSAKGRRSFQSVRRLRAP